METRKGLLDTTCKSFGPSFQDLLRMLQAEHERELQELRSQSIIVDHASQTFIAEHEQGQLKLERSDLNLVDRAAGTVVDMDSVEIATIDFEIGLDKKPDIPVDGETELYLSSTEATPAQGCDAADSDDTIVDDGQIADLGSDERQAEAELVVKKTSGAAFADFGARATKVVEAGFATFVTGAAAVGKAFQQETHNAITHIPTPNAGTRGITKGLSFKRASSAGPAKSHWKPLGGQHSSVVRARSWLSELRETHIRRAHPIHSPRQEFEIKVLNSHSWDIFMSSLILANIVVVIWETDTNASCPEAEKGRCASIWIDVANLMLLGIYTFECVMVIDAFRWQVLVMKIRLFELFILITGYADVILSSVLPNVQLFKAVRLVRCVRGARLLYMFPELRFLIVGFAGAMTSMLWGIVLLLLFLAGVAILAVELIHPLVKHVQFGPSSSCSDNFSSVWNAFLYLFQTIIAGDSWGQCTLPIIEYMPITVAFFGGTLLMLVLGFLNLIMSIILERVSRAHEADLQHRVHEKEKNIERTRKKWVDLFARLDSDESGELTMDELIKGFDEVPDFSTDLKLLGFEREHLPTLLTLMDDDGSDSINIEELLSLFDTVANFDNTMTQVSTSMQMRVIAQRIEERLDRLPAILHQSLLHAQDTIHLTEVHV